MSEAAHPFVMALRDYQLRQEAHLATMGDVPSPLRDWVAEMTRRHGSTFRWWHLGAPQWQDMNEVTGGTRLDLSAFAPGWLRGLLIVLYGEEPDHWPAQWTETEITRANSWMQGVTPRGVCYAGLSSRGSAQ